MCSLQLLRKFSDGHIAMSADSISNNCVLGKYRDVAEYQHDNVKLWRARVIIDALESNNALSLCFWRTCVVANSVLHTENFAHRITTTRCLILRYLCGSQQHETR